MVNNEFAGRNARVIHTNTNPRAGTCGIEEQLAEFCLRDGDMGDLLNPYEIFNPRPGLPPQQTEFNENFARGLVESCNRFVIMWLPTRIELPRRNTIPRDSSRKMEWHLRGAQRANFDRVLLNGIGLALNFVEIPQFGPQGCDPGRVSWEYFVLGDLIENEVMRTNLTLLMNSASDTMNIFLQMQYITILHRNSRIILLTSCSICIIWLKWKRYT